MRESREKDSSRYLHFANIFYRFVAGAHYMTKLVHLCLHILLRTIFCQKVNLDYLDSIKVNTQTGFLPNGLVIKGLIAPSRPKFFCNYKKKKISTR